MTELDTLIMHAFASKGKQALVNKVYLCLLQSNLFIPIDKNHIPSEEYPFIPLFSKVGDHPFLMAFDSKERLMTWASDYNDQMAYVELSGKDLIAGLSESVYLALNYDNEFYKEFDPSEIKHLKKIILKIEQLQVPINI